MLAQTSFDIRIFAMVPPQRCLKQGHGETVDPMNAAVLDFNDVDKSFHKSSYGLADASVFVVNSILISVHVFIYRSHHPLRLGLR